MSGTNRLNAFSSNYFDNPPDTNLLKNNTLSSLDLHFRSSIKLSKMREEFRKDIFI